MIRRTEHEIEVLREALDDEYHAWATYDQVITDFGEVAPFVNIREAEARHIEALRILYRGFGIPVPANNWPGRVARYPSLQAACEAGVVAEVANAELYDRLLAVPLRPEIATVLQKLRQASQDRHLPAFRRCAERQEVGGGCIRSWVRASSQVARRTWLKRACASGRTGWHLTFARHSALLFPQCTGWTCSDFDTTR